jgi:hypothetical protein
MTNDRNWFLAERSEALASLMLTSRPDVSVERETQHGDGVDLVVSVSESSAPATKFFVVQVRGTLSSDPKQWTGKVKPLFKQGKLYSPACVFVVNVRSNEVAYAWLAEPRVEGNSASLSFFEEPVFHSLDEAILNKIVDGVREW